MTPFLGPQILLGKGVRSTSFCVLLGGLACEEGLAVEPSARSAGAQDGLASANKGGSAHCMDHRLAHIKLQPPNVLSTALPHAALEHQSQQPQKLLIPNASGRTRLTKNTAGKAPTNVPSIFFFLGGVDSVTNVPSLLFLGEGLTASTFSEGESISNTRGGVQALQLFSEPLQC